MKEIKAPKITYMPTWFKVVMVVLLIIAFTLLGYLFGFFTAYGNLLNI